MVFAPIMYMVSYIVNILPIEKIVNDVVTINTSFKTHNDRSQSSPGPQFLRLKWKETPNVT